MSCGCKIVEDSAHKCGGKSSQGCPSVDICGNSYKLSVFDWLSNIESPVKSSDGGLVEVRFKNDRKLIYKNVNHLSLHIGSIVVVESSPGYDVGVVSLTGELVRIQIRKKKLSTEFVPKIYRLATGKDIEQWERIRKKEESVKKQARIIAKNMGLSMKISDIEYQGDGTKITFYYIADGRVDFRQLIKDYAQLFRTKIDMKQIGFRQESAKIGGLGSCGRELCCSTWLTDFRSVNTNVARYQQLSINPQKLAGQCGKLKCCLNFELDSYLDALENFPSSNTVLDTENGRASCIKIDVFKNKMWFAYVGKPMVWYDIEVKRVWEEISKNKKGRKTLPLEELVDKSGGLVQKKVDLIEENSIDRFEKKHFRNKHKNRRIVHSSDKGKKYHVQPAKEGERNTKMKGERKKC
ncbi:MAG: hypothetical protein FDW93_04710 [Bergeyella sp.]|nr:hypothetical protein [Bergeyella sp.]